MADLRGGARFETLQLHAGEDGDPMHAGFPPLYMASSFYCTDTETAQDFMAHKEKGHIYSRFSNPTVAVMEKRLAALEGYDECVSASSGLAAIAQLVFAHVKPGENLVSATKIYGGTYGMLNREIAALGIETRWVDDASDWAGWRKAITPKTKMLLFETPGNPLLNIVDIEQAVAICREYGLISVLDNTFATPYLQPVAHLGVDVVVHSLTKYIVGHGTVIGGATIGRKELMNPVRWGPHANLGPTFSPFNAWLVLMGLDTLSIRMERHSENAMELAKWLRVHPKVSYVYYPGLPDFPGHEIAKKQMKMFGGMVGFGAAGGYEHAVKTLDSLKLIKHQTSLGDVKTIILHPASSTHFPVPEDVKLKLGILPDYIRLSVGLEHVDDLKEDLDRALKSF
ncbi:MAG: aminotransferase class I/II-fold pyridoxal phosphate-dependent enzyme [bacterium]|jgi:cystathionine beta-lyase/cystathionine gamma-synthase